MIAEIKYHTKEEALAAFSKTGYDLEFCTPELKNNEEIVTAAIKKSGGAFYHASNELKSNKAFILKTINDGINPWHLILYLTNDLYSDLELMTLVVEKSHDGWEFQYAKENVAINKKLAAKALVKWGNCYGKNTINLWDELNPTIKECFPSYHFYEKAQAYLIQLEYQIKQEKQAEMVTGGSTTEDEVVW